MWLVWTIGGILVAIALALGWKWMAPKKCPKCKVEMRLLTSGCGKTKKYQCPKCKFRIDTGIPTGRGKR